MLSKEHYLAELQYELYFFNEEEINQIIDEYSELINDKLASGKSEVEILKELDTPKVVAQNYAKEFGINTSTLAKQYAYTSKVFKEFFSDINEKANSAMDNGRRKYHDSKTTKSTNKEYEDVEFEEQTNDYKFDEDIDMTTEDNTSNQQEHETNNNTNSQVDSETIDKTKTENTTVDKNANQKQKGESNLFYKIIIFPIFYTFYICAKLLEYTIKLATVCLMIATIIIFVLSFVFLDINVFPIIYRGLEIIVFISLMVAYKTLLSINFGKHE